VRKKPPEDFYGDLVTTLLGRGQREFESLAPFCGVLVIESRWITVAGGILLEPHVLDLTLNIVPWRTYIRLGNISKSWKILRWNILAYQSGRPIYSIITRYNLQNPER
jgi:hypothetical protein